MKRDVLRAAAYARVSSEQQAKDNTIASQVEALRQRIAQGVRSQKAVTKKGSAVKLFHQAEAEQRR
jgi:DNA invertase Pin-like site-specific DNA recombinase